MLINSVILPSVTALEAQIADLQTEATRLIRSLDSQKDATDQQAKAAAKRVDELTKEVEVKTKEIEMYKARLKQFADYDEIKRELEIMKVRSSTSLTPLTPSPALTF